MLRHLLRSAPAAAGAVAAAVLVLSSDWIARAQPQPSDDARFTGSSRQLDTDGLRLSHRWFEPGARSAWHRHADGQLLFVEAGRARVQKRGGPVLELGVGESDYTPPGVEHWHGAVPDQEFRQVAVGFGERTDWLEQVTDEEYGAYRP